MGKLTGKAALTTGVLQGTGGGIARTLARHDADLTLPDTPPEIERLADGLCGRGHRCTVVAADVRDPASVVVAIGHTREKERCIDILANNTGACCPGSSLDTSSKDRDFHINTNIGGVWNITKAMLLEMIARKDDRIVMMSSITGDMVADLSETAYALTKVAIVDLTKSLAVGYAQSGVHVDAICSGYIRTPMAENIARQSSPGDPESVPTKMAETIPMCRLADSLETDGLAAFLASGESSYSTGTQNAIDGGGTLLEAVSVDI